MNMLKKEVILGTDFKLNAQVWGDERNPPLLALHGWLENSSSFASLADLLSDYYIVAPDLPGHGCSPHLPKHALYTLDAQVLILLSVLDELGWERFSVVGHSLGAGIGAVLTAAIAEKISHLIMIDKLGPPVVADGAYLEQFQLNMQSRKHQSARQAIYNTIDEAVDIRCMFSECSKKAAELLAIRDLYPVSNGFASRTDRRLHFKSHRSMTHTQSQLILRSIVCPSLLIKADNGMLKGQNLNNETEGMSSLQVVDVTGSHHVHIDSPTRVATIIRSFLRDE